MAFGTRLAFSTSAALQRPRADKQLASATKASSATAVLSAHPLMKRYTLAPATLSPKPSPLPADSHSSTSAPTRPRPQVAPRLTPRSRRSARSRRLVIPDESSFYLLVGRRDVQLAPDLVVGARTFGNCQAPQLTIYFLSAQGRSCSYGQWKKDRIASSAGRPGPLREPLCVSAWSSDGRGGLQANRSRHSNSVRLSGNNLDMLATSSGRRHALTIYQRHPDQLGVGSFQTELL